VKTAEKQDTRTLHNSDSDALW